MQYEIVTDEAVNFSGLKRIDEDGIESWIPMDEANTDYQAYLLWLEENN